MKKWPLYTKTFLSFVALLITTVFIVGLIFNYSLVGYLESEISKSGIGKLKVAKNNHELLADSVIQNTVKVSLSPYLNQGLLDVLNKEKGTKSVDEQQMLRSILDSLTELERTYDGIQSVYLYLEDNGYIFSTKTGIDPIDNFNDTQWVELLEENKSKGIRSFWMPSRILYNLEQKGSGIGLGSGSPDYSPVVTYVYSLTSYTTQLQGAVIINLYESKLSSLINSKNPNNEGSIYILNSKGIVFSHTDKEYLGKNISEEETVKRILEDKNEEGQMVINDDERQLITYYKSDFNGWIYVGIFPLDTLMSKAESLRTSILLVLCAILVVGGATAYLISRRLFSPVRKLIQDVKVLRGIDIYEEKNEVTILAKAFDTMIRQDRQMYSLLEENRKEVRRSFLLNLLQDAAYMCKDVKLSIPEFRHRYYCCIIIAIDRYKDFAAGFSDEQQDYMQSLIIGIFKEVLSSKLVCEGLQIEKDKMVFIINTDQSDYESTHKILKKDISIARKEVARVLDNTLTISIGNIHESAEGIKLSYSEASDLLKLRLLWGHGSIISFNKASYDERKYQYPFTHETHILNQLGTGSKTEILSSIEAFINQIKAYESLSYDNAVLILNQLLGSTIRYLLDSKISISQVFGNSFNIYQELLDNETLDEVGLWLGKVYVSIIDYFGRQKSDNKEYIEEAIDYIHHNYKSDIDINALAERIGISYSQLRRTFLKEKGENLVNYINKLRIEEAKRLLLYSEETIADLAVNLGYNSDRNFNRFFKKYEGITPGEFRKAFK